VTEAKSADGHWFGEPRLEAFLRAAGRPAAVRTLSAELIDAVRQYEDGCAQSDDITCLTVRLALPFAEHPSPAVAVDAR
jgi:serine phosphatase RsbU (regulator of sigma subunit)